MDIELRSTHWRSDTMLCDEGAMDICNRSVNDDIPPDIIRIYQCYDRKWMIVYRDVARYSDISSDHYDGAFI